MLTLAVLLAVMQNACAGHGIIYNPADSILYFPYPSPNAIDADYQMLFRFYDGGSRMDMVNHDIPGTIIVGDGIPGHLFTYLQYVNGSREAYESVDFGETWTLTETFPQHNIYVEGNRPGENVGEGFVRRAREEVGSWICHTSDSWRTYDSVEVVPPDTILFVWLSYVNGLFYGVTHEDYRICVSADTGASWSVGSAISVWPNSDPLICAGAADEIWGWLRRVFVVQDTGRTVIDSVYIPELINIPYQWLVTLVATNHPGETYLVAYREIWTEPSVLEVKLYHILNYGAQVDSFEYAFELIYDNIEKSESLPELFTVSLFPNPFNSFVTISMPSIFSLQKKVTVYDLLGREVWHWNGYNSSIQWNGVSNQGAPLSSGRYWIQVQFNDMNKTIPVVLLK